MMRIGNNYQGIMQLFSRVNGGKANTNKLFSGGASAKGAYCGNTIDDLLSGHFKNSYGVEGMGISGKTDWKRIVNVSDEMKRHVYEDVKKNFYKYGGMSGDTAETDAYYDKIHSYVKTLDLSARRAAPWTLGQLHLEIAERVTQAVKEKDPTWTAGKPISREILDEIFADDTIYQDSVNALYSKGGKGLDMKI